MAQGNPSVGSAAGNVPVAPAQEGTTPGAGTMPQTVTPGAEGKGIHGSGQFATDANSGAGLSAELTREVAPGLFRDKNDEDIVMMGWSPIPINAMMRDQGSRKMDSAIYKYYSVDLRVTEGATSAAISVTSADTDRNTPNTLEAVMANSYVFNQTDLIAFEAKPTDGEELYGWAQKGQNYVCTKPAPLVARVSAIPSGGKKLNIQFLNAKPGASFTIPANTKVYILGHAAAEEDASTTPWISLPTPDEQYMQKFMVQSQISNEFLEQAKEVKWTENDVDKAIVQQLLEDQEKTYIFGTKSYTFDPDLNRHTRTCSGILEMMLLGGSPVIPLYKEDLTFKDMLEATNKTFIGNSGSNKRYVYHGCNVGPAIWGISDITKMAKVSEFHNFNYDFTSLNLLGYHLPMLHHPLFDKMGEQYRNWALVIDRQYLERRVFRSMEDYELELKKTGVYDGKSRVWCEISSPCLKYPKAHALWIFYDGKRPEAETESGSAA